MPVTVSSVPSESSKPASCRPVVAADFTCRSLILLSTTQSRLHLPHPSEYAPCMPTCRTRPGTQTRPTQTGSRNTSPPLRSTARTPPARVPAGAVRAPSITSFWSLSACCLTCAPMPFCQAFAPARRSTTSCTPQLGPRPQTNLARYRGSGCLRLHRHAHPQTHLDPGKINNS